MADVRPNKQDQTVTASWGVIAKHIPFFKQKSPANALQHYVIKQLMPPVINSYKLTDFSRTG